MSDKLQKLAEELEKKAEKVDLPSEYHAIIGQLHGAYRAYSNYQNDLAIAFLKMVLKETVALIEKMKAEQKRLSDRPPAEH